LADGHVGELQVRSPANCVGYWDDPEATATTFDGGWLRTGDLVRRDGDRFFWFAGRVKQIIIRGGSNISPQEVEEALYRHPSVLEAGVIGLPDPIHGEKVIAFVALRRTYSPGERTTGFRSWLDRGLQDSRADFISPCSSQRPNRKGATTRSQDLFLTLSEGHIFCR
jgi:long-chain acyl-CoA synthetase